MTPECASMITRYGIDYEDAMDRFGGNEALFTRLAVKFRDDNHFAALEKALAAQDVEEAHRQAHGLKGVAGNLSFAALHREASVISDALRNNDVRAASEHLPAARAAYNDVMEALRYLG